ncbi:NCS2 family permease [Phaeacidiphilus oryzae]|uniref:NCS2 family permease n=1 Tax=Phaeacidiphilus oryzae TaxID=348818 RepID=UPI000562FA12|nr:NCS2 family permease [Phaeacidiphilus oryzae]
MSSPAAAQELSPKDAPPRHWIDRYFEITQRGSTVGRELRGGVVTFFAMAYIIVLNPIILSSGVDKYGHHLSSGQLVTATCITAAFTTLLMGVIGRVPIALAAGLGVNSMVSLQIAPKTTWPEAMGMVTLAGICIMILVATGLRQRVMAMIPDGLRKGITMGIGLFILMVGMVDGGFISRVPDAAHTTTPVQLGSDGHLNGWPVLCFVLGVLLMLVLMARKVPGAVLISIAVVTVVAIIINTIATIPADSWGLTIPSWPHKVVAAPDFGLMGKLSLFGGFKEVGILPGILFVFSILLSTFFDAMGTIMGVTEEAGLLDENGDLPGMSKVLMIDGVATALGGVSSSSGSTAFVESTTGVGEGARTGLASVFTGVLFALALFLSPIALVVPQQAAAPALVAVGFLILSAHVRSIDWSDYTIGVPVFFTMLVMPLTYSITSGIGAGFIAFTVLKAATGRVREIPWMMWIVSVIFVVYFALGPIEQALGVG